FAIRALRGVLPPAVLGRGNKGDLRPGISRDVRPIASDAAAQMERWLLVQRGYLDVAIVRTLIARFLDGSQPTEAAVRQLLLCELRLQRLVGRPASAAPTHTDGLTMPSLVTASSRGAVATSDAVATAHSLESHAKGGESSWSTLRHSLHWSVPRRTWF